MAIFPFLCKLHQTNRFNVSIPKAPIDAALTHVYSVISYEERNSYLITFPNLCLQRRQAQASTYKAKSHKIDYVSDIVLPVITFTGLGHNKF